MVVVACEWSHYTVTKAHHSIYCQQKTTTYCAHVKTKMNKIGHICTPNCCRYTLSTKVCTFYGRLQQMVHLCTYCQQKVHFVYILSTNGTFCIDIVNKRYIFCTYCQQKVHFVHILSTKGALYIILSTYVNVAFNYTCNVWKWLHLQNNNKFLTKQKMIIFRTLASFFFVVFFCFFVLFCFFCRV